MNVRPPVETPGESTPTFSPFIPRIAGSRSMFGMVEDAAYWNAVVKLYDEDKLEGAAALLERVGMGVAATGASVRNLIESEFKSRREGKQQRLSPHLTLEYIPSEQAERAESMGQFSLQIVQALKKRFPWNEDEDVLLTLLSSEEDAPWATARYGYCAQKTDYYKVCVPFHATHDPHAFHRVFAHEFSHVISLSQSHRRVNHWVGEGFSVYASDDCDDRARQAFISNPHLWLSPDHLELQFGPSLDLGTQKKWFAYQQAGWIIRYLGKTKGDASLMRFLAEYADESILRNLKLLALGQSRTRDALHAALDQAPEKLFKDVRKSLEFDCFN